MHPARHQFDEADITELEAFRKAQSEALREQGVRLTVLAFLVKAVAASLRRSSRTSTLRSPAGDSARPQAGTATSVSR
jgi:pyruvate dehydrogenase E2 component (dihydrolipoamide acetyltransferase)